MAVISVSITESTEQVVSGIPRIVAISTNVPSSIFYTLDGTIPTILSDIYITPIVMPTDKPIVLLKIFATNGVDSSPIIEESYSTTLLNNARLPHSATTQQPSDANDSLYPFGTNAPGDTSQFLNPAGITVDNPNKTQISNGFDGYGQPNNFTNEELSVENYSIVYTTTDAEGRTGPFIGNLPATVNVEQPPSIPENSSLYSTVFDPRAYVIFQDVSLEDPTSPPQINNQNFTLQDPKTYKDGINYFNTGLDAPPLSGSFIRSHFNPRDNSITYYYFDSSVNKWIISKAPYNPANFPIQSYAGIISTRQPGSRFVYEWLPFTRRVLF